MELSKLQKEVKEVTKNLDLANTPELCGLDFASEVGEVAKEILELTNYGKREHIYNSDLARELGDSLYSLIALANIYDIDLEEQLHNSLEKYKIREQKRKDFTQCKVRLEPIVLSKNFLCINAVAGCRNDCVYCYKHGWDIENKFRPTLLFEVPEILKNIETHRYFHPNIPLAVHNSATDPFQEGVTDITFEILDGLEDQGITNIVALITKEYVSEEIIKKLESYKNIRPIIFVTYSFLPKEFENVIVERRIESMKNLSKSKLKRILYYRPIISGVNDSEKIAKDIVTLGEKYFDCIVRSPLKVDVNIIEYMAKKNIYIDSHYDIGLNIHDSLKQMLPESRERVDKILAQSKVPYFKKTSCGISYLFGQADYNTQWIRKDIYCSRNCPKKQQQRCLKQSTQKPTDKIVEELLRHLELDCRYMIYDDRVLIVSEKVFYSDIKYLRMVLKFPVLVSINNQELTAEEYDRKYVNADRTEIRKIIKKKGIDNY